MGKNKLKRFEENATFRHLVQPSYETVVRGAFPLRGRWNEDFFDVARPITLELGCGRGEYTLALSETQAERNFLGMDVKGARLWKGAKQSAGQTSRRIGFVRGRIETLGALFGQNEVDEIWITFPDPQLKTRREKKRLTSPGFLHLYGSILRPGGCIHLKTDSEELYTYTLRTVQRLGCPIVANVPNVDNALSAYPYLSVRTRYEEIFRARGKAIKYLSFTLPRQLAVSESELVTPPSLRNTPETIKPSN